MLLIWVNAISGALMGMKQFPNSPIIIDNIIKKIMNGQLWLYYKLGYLPVKLQVGQVPHGLKGFRQGHLTGSVG